MTSVARDVMTEELAEWVAANGVVAVAPASGNVFGIWHARHGDQTGYGATEGEALLDLKIRLEAAEIHADRKARGWEA